MIIRLTKKAREQIKADNLKTESSFENQQFLEEWYVNLFLFNRHKYFIFTEARTLFSIISYAKSITSLTLFTKFLVEELTNTVRDLIPEMQLLSNDVDSIIFTKTKSKAVLKIQSDHIYHAIRYAKSNVNAFEVNRIPLKCLNFETPESLFLYEIRKIINEYEKVKLLSNQMN